MHFCLEFTQTLKDSNMQQTVSAIFLCAVFTVTVAADCKLPATIERCNSTEPGYFGCLRKAVQDALPQLIHGLPDCNFPALDPFFSAREAYDFLDGPLRARSVTTNSTIYGVAETEVLSVTARRQRNSFYVNIDVAIPKIFIEGYYETYGSMLGYRIGGKGKYNISMTGLTTAWTLSGPVENDKWTVKQFIMLPQVTTMKVYFDDLFNGNEALNRIGRDFVNVFWPILYSGMLPTVARGWNTQLSGVVNEIFSKVSFSSTFP